MAFLQCQFYSNSLEIMTSVNVILPEKIEGPLPTLYLLHGLSDDHTVWGRRTSIERYAAEYQLAVVMPAVNRSFYTDMAYGAKYWTFISEELPERVRSMFPLSPEREYNFAAGLSMGGYGAMKLGLSHPDRYAAVASMSGAVDSTRLTRDEFVNDMTYMFGTADQLKNSSNDLFALANQVSTKGVVPLLYQCCGTEDFLYEDNIRFRDHLTQLGLALTYEEEPGEHEWGYWDWKIQRVLSWLPIPNRK
ncbi:MAG: alpha/beta hydrolase family protein [Candidatus Cohnella colombiensis]|uniref:Alpha/beta hydrolase family protein n=1 Tax=Candidatus Cohnella colombiensis TaxID=3121368 RepID=A0AA95EUP2_9BACL|nr:MAG: alpha/beta hydrolase family protein [Cohnella sp.]